MDAGRVIWRRNVDEEGHRRAMRRFYLGYAAPSLAAVVLVAAFGGVGNAAGLAILLGLFGLMLFIWVWGTGRNRRVNPEVRFDGRHLTWARRQVPVAAVTRFTTFQTTMTIHIDPSSHAMDGKARLGTVRFELDGEKPVEFLWPDLGYPELDTLRLALEEILPGRWHPSGATPD